MEINDLKIDDLVELKTLEEIENDGLFERNALGFVEKMYHLTIPSEMFKWLGKTVTVKDFTPHTSGSRFRIFDDDGYWVYCKSLIKNIKPKIEYKKISFSLDDFFSGNNKFLEV